MKLGPYATRQPRPDAEMRFAALEIQNARLRSNIVNAIECLEQYLDEDNPNHTEDYAVLAEALAFLRGRGKTITGPKESTE